MEQRLAASPLVRRRRLGVELRRLREGVGKSIDAAAAHLECSAAKVSRIETGRVAARVQDVRDLLDLYGVTGQFRDDLIQLVRDARQRAWWKAYSDILQHHDGLETLIGLEDAAATLSILSCGVLPGLLQTRDYATVVAAAVVDKPTEFVERQVELRMSRQAVLARENAPDLSVVVDEAALHRVVGGARTMAAQLRHLVERAAEPNITVQVLPFQSGAYPAISLPFTILGFADPTDPKVVCAEHLVRTEIVERAGDVGQYVTAFDYVRGVALDPAQSVRFIENLMPS